MSGETVIWRPMPGPEAAGGLRERKKRQMRDQLSSTATRLFLERGFDAVRVTEIAQACGVSEKTVFNYFPTKESLLLDRFDDTLDALRAALADPGTPPVDAALGVLAAELDGLTGWLAAQPDPDRAAADLRRFHELSVSTPGLRTHQLEMTDRITGAVAQILAGRWGQAAGDPEPQIAAIALVGLWRVHGTALGRHFAGPDARERVTAEVRRAAETIRPVFRR